MRDPKRIQPIIALLQLAWEKNPDWRLGQLVDNAYRVSETHKNWLETGVRLMEDDELAVGLHKLAKGLTSSC